MAAEDLTTLNPQRPWAQTPRSLSGRSAEPWPGMEVDGIQKRQGGWQPPANPVALVITGSRQSAAPWFPAIGGSASKCSKWQLRKNGTHLERRVQGSGSCKESVTAPSGVEDTCTGFGEDFICHLAFILSETASLPPSPTPSPRRVQPATWPRHILKSKHCAATVMPAVPRCF